MRTSTLVIIAVALLVNGLIIGGLLGWGADAAARAATVKVHAAPITTLATIEVHPSPAELAALARADHG